MYLLETDFKPISNDVYFPFKYYFLIRYNGLLGYVVSAKFLGRITECLSSKEKLNGTCNI